MALVALLTYLITLAYAVAQARGNSFTVPWWFWRQAMCVHSHEANTWTINNPPYAGGMQFTLHTWNSVGSDAATLAEIANASPAEQVYRAYLVWRRDGGSWVEWPSTSRMCGLR